MTARSVSPDDVQQEHWDLASRTASLGVGHIWTAVGCPAYRTLDPADCTCVARNEATR